MIHSRLATPYLLVAAVLSACVRGYGVSAPAEPNHDYKSLHRVLIIEDNEPAASLLEFLFSRAGYEVLIAANGRAALEALEKIEPTSMILLDLMLPYVSGYQVLTEARENALWRDVPILVLSGKVLETDVVKALDLGARQERHHRP